MHKAARATMIEAEKPPSDKLTEIYTHTMLAGGAGSLPSAVERMLRLIDGARTLEEVCGLCGLPPQRGVAVARKLEALGMICRGHGGAFSDLEEEFFAAEVPPDEAPPPAPWSQRLLQLLLQKRSTVDSR